MTEELRIAVYVSGHGFGHAAQVAPVLNALKWRTLIRSSVPRWFFAKISQKHENSYAAFVITPIRKGKERSTPQKPAPQTGHNEPPTIEGRVAPSVADVKALAEPVLKHRMALSYTARADGETIEGLIAKLAEKL